MVARPRATRPVASAASRSAPPTTAGVPPPVTGRRPEASATVVTVGCVVLVDGSDPLGRAGAGHVRGERVGAAGLADHEPARSEGPRSARGRSAPGEHEPARVGGVVEDRDRRRDGDGVNAHSDGRNIGASTQIRSRDPARNTWPNGNTSTRASTGVAGASRLDVGFLVGLVRAQLRRPRPGRGRAGWPAASPAPRTPPGRRGAPRSSSPAGRRPGAVASIQRSADAEPSTREVLGERARLVKVAAVPGGGLGSRGTGSAAPGSRSTGSPDPACRPPGRRCRCSAPRRRWPARRSARRRPAGRAGRARSVALGLALGLGPVVEPGGPARRPLPPSRPASHHTCTRGRVSQPLSLAAEEVVVEALEVVESRWRCGPCRGRRW